MPHSALSDHAHIVKAAHIESRDCPYRRIQASLGDLHNFLPRAKRVDLGRS